jgi:16S rRNA (cytidine1402-2'-O)-methyltransferase
VRACIEKGIRVIPVPGCSAGIAALSVSGTDAREFAFYGFLPREKKALREKLREISEGVPVAVIHESPFRITELTECIAETLPEARMTVCCDLTKLHEKTIYGNPVDVLAQLKANEKTEKGEYCVVLDFHNVPQKENETQGTMVSIEARLIDEMKKGQSLREAQENLVASGEKKNAVKQAALFLKKMFTDE